MRENSWVSSLGFRTGNGRSFLNGASWEAGSEEDCAETDYWKVGCCSKEVEE